jgi:hypothetical protein
MIIGGGFMLLLLLISAIEQSSWRRRHFRMQAAAVAEIRAMSQLLYDSLPTECQQRVVDAEAARRKDASDRRAAALPAVLRARRWQWLVIGGFVVALLIGAVQAQLAP